MKIIVNKLLDIFGLFLMACFSLIAFAFAIGLISAIIIGPAYLAKTFDNYWFLLLYPLVAAFAISSNPDYLTRECNDDEMP